MENMRTTKTWKYKTKLVALAVFTAASAVFGSFGALAAPASADTYVGGVPLDSVICRGNELGSLDSDGSLLILIDAALYNEHGCQVIKVWYTTGNGSWRSRAYSYAHNCSYKKVVAYVEEMCVTPGARTIITLENYNNNEECFHPVGSGGEGYIKRDCAGIPFNIDLG